MKQISNKIKILIAIILVLAIAASIVVATIGFNVEKQYQENNIVIITFDDEIDIKNIENIAKETFGEKYTSIQYVDYFKDIVQISAKEITDEKKAELVDKINKSYNWTVEENNENEENSNNTDKAIDASKLEITKIPNVSIVDLLKPYLISIAIASVIILVYIAIRFFKKGMLKNVIMAFIIMVLTQLVVLSLIAVTRCPIGRYTPAIILVSYMISVIETIKYLEKKSREK